MRLKRFHLFENVDFGIYEIIFGGKSITVKPDVQEEGHKVVLLDTQEGIPLMTISIDLEQKLPPGYFYAQTYQDDKKEVIKQLEQQGFIQKDVNNTEFETPYGISKVYKIINY